MNLKNFFKFKVNDVMEFYCHPDHVDVIPEPKPAVKNLPDWFKNLKPTVEVDKNLKFEEKLKVERDSYGIPAATAKRCLPMLDAMSLGYTIPLCADVHIISNHDNTKIHVVNPPNLEICSNHKSYQLGGDHKLGIKHGDALKFTNLWVVKTAPGWSTLFIPPLNHFDSPFTCLSGFVDTDAYPKHVNFPAILTKYDVDLHLPAGTPLVTAIPIKRDAFPQKPKVRKITNKEIQLIDKMGRAQQINAQYYVKKLRNRD